MSLFYSHCTVLPTIHQLFCHKSMSCIQKPYRTKRTWHDQQDTAQYCKRFPCLFRLSSMYRCYINTLKLSKLSIRREVHAAYIFINFGCQDFCKVVTSQPCTHCPELPLLDQSPWPRMQKHRQDSYKDLVGDA